MRVVSHCIEAAARRPADAAAPYGGEEFGLILPETDAHGAFVIAENLRSKVRGLAIGHAGSEKGIVTVSIGVSTFEAAAAIEIADLLSRADEALYGAKPRGGTGCMAGVRTSAANARPVRGARLEPSQILGAGLPVEFGSRLSWRLPE
ncbi:diguanylate cyclase [Mesorhizobium sp. B2-3-11]|uniref:diguanylate cyclase n=1 Tax=Mesorhizobium sp. B2-3-11 TaxID=2589953 RepID=UPI00248474ED|nr:diguanylate cyclase [Mesorhizobium sp. B2-3-11]